MVQAQGEGGVATEEEVFQWGQLEQVRALAWWQGIGEEDKNLRRGTATITAIIHKIDPVNTTVQGLQVTVEVHQRRATVVVLHQVHLQRLVDTVEVPRPVHRQRLAATIEDLRLTLHQL